MEKKEIIAESPITVAGMTLVPVSEVTLNYFQGKAGIAFFGLKKPVCVVLVSPSAKRAFRMTGEEVPLVHLIEEVPALKEIVEHL